MRYGKAFITVILAATVSGCATNAGLFSSKKAPVALSPYGVNATSPAVIRMVKRPHSPLHKGATVLSVNGKPVTAYTFYRAFTPKCTSKIKSVGGTVNTVADRKLLSEGGNHLNVFTLPAGGTFIFKQKVPVYKRTQNAGLIYLGREQGLVAASIWNTKPRILELYLDLHASQSCQSCNLKNIGVMDWSRKSWLTSVAVNKVAELVYPRHGEPGPLMNVPPPTPVGYTSTSDTTGSFNGTIIGNGYNGNYSGTTITTTTPQYNYSATNLSELHNLAVILARDRIKRDNKYRRDFVTDRIVNLKLGPLAPGERMSGYVDFVVPNGFDGPFIVVVKGNSKDADIRFDLKNK